MLSLVSATAIAGLVLNDICRKDTDCAKGETCTFPPRIARACVERDEFSRWERCTDELAHCCPKGTACKGSSWWKSCWPLVGKCEKPEICCMAIPQCKDGFKEVKEGVCTKEDFALGECVEESLCCTTITCKKEKKGCKLSCGTEVADGWTGKDEGPNYCNTCSCRDGLLGCTRMGCDKRPCPGEGKSCKLSCGTEVADGWSGMGEGSNHCNQCGCNDGLLRCTKMACMKRPCPGEGKSCKLSCGTEVADGWTGKDEGPNYCNTCSCRDGLLGCTKIGCDKRPCPGEGKSCKLSCGTEVADGWSGMGEGSNHCNQCGCNDGLLRCTEMACMKRPCPGEGKSCELSCGTVVADGWKGNDEGANHCNTCSCRDGLLGCTEMECLEKKECPCNEFTKESPCIALEGVCYNAGQCTCGFFSQVKCKAAPCSVNSCPKGYTCRNNYCGGCNFQCVKEE